MAANGEDSLFLEMNRIQHEDMFFTFNEAWQNDYVEHIIQQFSETSYSFTTLLDDDSGTCLNLRI